MLEKLNPEQKKAVLTTKGPVLIFAGAGSGKTRVITHRIAHLILNLRTDSICAVTFTNKAAFEMEERVLNLVGMIPSNTKIKTFHSLGLYILRNEAKHFNYNSNFTIYDIDLQESLIRQIIKDFNLDLKLFPPGVIANKISSLKDQLISTEGFYTSIVGNSYDEEIYHIYKEYEKRKTACQGFDFADLIYQCIQLFFNFPKILEKYNNRWEYIMVDEYQDTNKAQYQLTKMLADKNQNICVVGDDDQSIYSWRGADISNIFNFENDFQNPMIIKLEENYRSSSNIIRAASNIIQNNQKRKKKSIFTNNLSGEKITLITFRDDKEEAMKIVEEINKIYQESHTYKDIAIFYRINALSRKFEEAMRNFKIPYKIFGGFRFYDRKEIKDIIAYLNVIVNPEDTTSLLRIINCPPRGIGEKTIEKVRKFSMEKNISLFESISKFDLPFSKAVSKSFHEIAYLFLEWQKMERDGVLPSSIGADVLKRSGLMETYSEISEDALERVENLREFISSLEDYEKSTPLPSLGDYLSQISLLGSDSENNKVTDYVNLMTVHSSKGLEFDTVFLVGMEEGTFPHAYALEDGEAMEEERRLAYVAVTRAKRKLYLSYNNISNRYGKLIVKVGSRFLREIDSDLIDRLEGYHNVYEEESISEAPYARNYSHYLEKKNNFPITYSPRSIFKIHDKVKHRQYGVGKIVSISGENENQKVKIQFGRIEKNFLLAYTPLEKL